MSKQNCGCEYLSQQEMEICFLEFRKSAARNRYREMHPIKEKVIKEPKVFSEDEIKHKKELRHDQYLRQYANTMIHCECGLDYLKSRIKRHVETKKHKKFLEEKEK